MASSNVGSRPTLINSGHSTGHTLKGGVKPRAPLSSLSDVNPKPATRQTKTSLLRKEAVVKAANKNVKPEVAPPSPVPMEMGTPAEEKQLVDVKDIDKEDADNPQLCSEFVSDIYQYMLYLEACYPVKKHYLGKTSLKPKMRSILVDWLFQVHQRFQLLQETIYLTVAILDRFLQVEIISRTKLQLAGVAAMLIASKYEEMYAPEVTDFVYITDKAFSKDEILAMENVMLKTLGFNLGRPLPLHFLRRNSKAGEVDASHHALAKYLMELALLDYEMCHVPPSKVAAGALCLSLKILADEEWTSTLRHYSTYSEPDLKPVICHLAKSLTQASTNQYVKSIRAKYSSQKCLKVALFPNIKAEFVKELAAESANEVL